MCYILPNPQIFRKQIIFRLLTKCLPGPYLSSGKGVAYREGKRCKMSRAHNHWGRRRVSTMSHILSSI